MSVQTVLNTALFNQLSGGTALVSALGGTAIYFVQAPDEKPLPYVVWSYQAGGPENITPSDLWSELAFVRAYAETPAQAGTIDALIHARLHKQTLSISGYTNFWTVREGDAPALIDNQPNGQKAFMSGGMYRIRFDS
jgi:hypothetical protein